MHPPKLAGSFWNFLYIMLPLPLLKAGEQANRSAIQATLTAIQANPSAIQANPSAIQANPSAIQAKGHPECYSV